MQPGVQCQDILQSALSLAKELQRFALYSVIGALWQKTPTGVSEVFTCLGSLLQEPLLHESPSAGLQVDASHASRLLESAGKLTATCLSSASFLAPADQAVLRTLHVRVSALRAKHTALQDATSHGVTFVWVESPLVTAAKAGEWVSVVCHDNNAVPKSLQAKLFVGGCMCIYA